MNAPTSTLVRRHATVAAAALLLGLAVLGTRERILLCGLKAAGLTGTPPPNAALIQSLIDKMTSNWLWLVGTGVGLVAVLVAGMMAFGSQRAPDVMFRVVAGVGLILIVIPGALA